jgi:para-nitrobenzyl esterase
MCADAARPVVRTAHGSVAGRVTGGVLAFRGIPYAESPVGDLRFAPPRPPRPWTGVREAGEPGRRAPQLPGDPAFEALFGSPVPTGEDCLTLDVWTPAAGAAGLPVLVWLHAGGFVTGAGSDPCYAGAAFARDGVVFVAVNYRLGCLGWLHLDELVAGAAGTGNLGLQDQLAALDWVQVNVGAFGGDPDRVTLGGISAGGGATAALLAAPRARGLFRRAIVQSGASIDAVSAPVANAVARRFLALAGVASGDARALRDAAVPALLDAQRRLGAEAAGTHERELLDRPGGLGLVFGPVVDGGVLPAPPIEAAERGDTHDVELLIGTTADEWRLFCCLGDLPDDETCEAAIAKALEADPELAALAREDAVPRWPALCAVETELSFALPAQRLAAAHAARGAAVYAYRFAWRSSYAAAELGACHGLDLPFVFDDLGGALGRALAARAPAQLASDMHAAWVEFVATGRPSAPGLAWPAFRADAPATMVIDERWRLSGRVRERAARTA